MIFIKVESKIYDTFIYRQKILCTIGKFDHILHKDTLAHNLKKAHWKTQHKLVEKGKKESWKPKPNMNKLSVMNQKAQRCIPNIKK